MFAGKLSQSQQDELMLKLTRTLGKRPGKLLMLPVCETDWDGRREKIVKEKDPQEQTHAGGITQDAADADDQSI